MQRSVSQRANPRASFLSATAQNSPLKRVKGRNMVVHLPSNEASFKHCGTVSPSGVQSLSVVPKTNLGRRAPLDDASPDLTATDLFRVDEQLSSIIKPVEP